MREIKFRVWIKEKKKIYIPKTMTFRNSGELTHICINDAPNEYTSNLILI